MCREPDFTQRALFGQNNLGVKHCGLAVCFTLNMTEASVRDDMLSSLSQQVNFTDTETEGSSDQVIGMLYFFSSNFSCIDFPRY
mmetsp:Transcript_28796/g.42647  ORF Transcript_28796/g.42647 Transcript_28796/m.42647 type:complete len:84 (+) Transcript_28796:127-378(+)